MKGNKFCFLFFLTILVFSNSSYCQSTYELASREYFNGDLNKSVELFTESIKAKQEIAKSYMYRGAANSFLNKLTEAKNDLDSSMILDSLNEKIYYYYGKLYLFKGEYHLSIRYYDIAILKNPRYSAAYDERAVSKSLMNDFLGAIKDEDIAIELDSTKQIYYTDRGFAKLKLKQYKASIKDFDASLKIEPNQKAYANRGLAYSLLNLHRKAIEDYTKSLEINPADFEIYYYRGLSYKALDDKEKSCNDLKRSAELGYVQAGKDLKTMGCN